MSEDRRDSPIRRFRLRAGLTQEEVADRSGLSVRTIRGLESGKQRNPQLASLRQLAAAMSLDPAESDELLAELGVISPTPSGPAVPRQLPAAPGLFTGRDLELSAIDGSTAVITAIAGPGGIGKTWLALRWAHRNLDRFPDGQLFVDLRGYSPDSEPAEPLAVVRGFLEALGVYAGRVGGSLDDYTALYRSQLADKRMLIVLDNAATAEQVVPLLPGSATCAVLVTSRRILTSLLHRHSVNHLSLSVFGEDETHEALAERLGDKRLAAEPEAVAELVELCGRYPLALAIVAGRAHARPDIPLAEFATELRESGLDAFDDGDDAASLPAVVSWSVRALSVEQRVVFGRLGVAPGGDISLPAAASLVAMSLPQTRKALREMEDASLIRRQPGDRYAMHDIIRRYAVDTVHNHIAEADREASLRRVLDFYVHTAHAADRLLAPHRPVVPPGPPSPGTHTIALADYTAALAWFDAEHANLLAAQETAVAHGWAETTWQVAWTLAPFHTRRPFERESLALWLAAHRAVDQLPDPEIRLRTLRRLGVAHSVMGQHDEAIARLDQALAQGGEAGFTHYELSAAWARHGDYRRALEHATLALDLVRGTGLDVWEASGHVQVGYCLARLGELDAAHRHYQETLLLDYHDNPVVALDIELDLGYIAHHNGQNRHAVQHYRRALALVRPIGHIYAYAKTLHRLGHAQVALGQHDAARAAWEETVMLCRQLGHTEDADHARRHLDELGLRDR
ncbi:ATP-binding protein [Kutzneria sp. CA-103260]|uniref:ATP-binding protein n=1 Tax=Kutzneria sp. CA-103260 TaxID=2802641 RepID=UPI001BA4E62D|nr:helix-turn-helix domain-containing protein [Kutzneria sp. CA-103260]QUQ68638.1 SARP family transcriptional regulator [Kutzneria sp. CA-103260]